MKNPIYERFEDSTCSNICGLFNGKVIPCPPPPCGKKIELIDGEVRPEMVDEKSVPIGLTKEKVANRLNNILEENLPAMKINETIKIGNLKITLENENTIRYIDDSCMCNSI